MILLSDIECVEVTPVTRRRRIFGKVVFLSLRLPPPLSFVTRPRPIFARVQDGAGDSELRVFRDKNTHKPPASGITSL